jgi:hypothetical protein
LNGGSDEDSAISTNPALGQRRRHQLATLAQHRPCDEHQSVQAHMR